MTADQLIAEVFIHHWLFTTIVFPPLTFLYAWVTDQTAWWIGSLAIGFLYCGISLKR